MPKENLDIHSEITLPLVSTSVLVAALAKEALDAHINYKTVEAGSAQLVLSRWIEAQNYINKVLTAVK
jgi:hypothetical protein